jgi:hypothetical protein
MIRYAAVPLLAILAACSAEVENGEAAEETVVETLSVNNLIITDSNAAAIAGDMGAQAPASQPPQTAAPADRRNGGATAAEPKQQTRPSADAAAKRPPKPSAEPAGNSEPEPEAPAGTCTPEHREMGHC